jgi:hypothetical protein
MGERILWAVRSVEQMEHGLYALIAVLALICLFQRNIRFLMEGLWYRRLDGGKQALLARHEPRWHDYHGRRISWMQLVAGIVVAAVVVGLFICRDWGIF